MGQFRGAGVITLCCLVLAGGYGWVAGGTLSGALEVVWVVTILAVLEISLSFDNAVVNAAILGGMDAVWRRRFLTWGLAVSVVGVRIVLPVLIVAVSAGLGPVDALRLSLEQPARYEAILKAGHLPIAGFGGAFLLVVGLKFFLEPGKDLHLIGLPERMLKHLGRMRMAEIAITLVVVLGLAASLPAGGLRFGVAGAAGTAAFEAMEALAAALERRQQGAVAASGLGAFLYLNLLDASFSLDGVIGAFALTNKLIIIALGLTIGAVFVRAMTMAMVESGTLARYRFLEHGAFWAILALGGCLLASARVEVPEALTGLTGAVLIGAAIWSSARRAQ